jgi:protein arginine kinase
MSGFDSNDLVGTPGAWLDGSGDENEIVLSSRVRIARNLHGHRFTHNCDNAELDAILRKSLDAAQRARAFTRSRYIAMGEISTLDRFWPSATSSAAIFFIIRPRVASSSRPTKPPAS